MSRKKSYTCSKRGSMNLSDYESLEMAETCRWCGTVLPDVLNHYDHPAGEVVEGFEKPQWLYKVCVNCDYQWSLRKLRNRKAIGSTGPQPPGDTGRGE